MESSSSLDRSWPPPRSPWALAMRWSDLLFAHWPIDAALLESKVPAGLSIDQFDGSAWIGVVPFRMSGVRPAGAPELPFLSTFPELNVRTYVTRDGKPGVWFLSLDAASRLAVVGARAAFHLPYFHARMSCRRRERVADALDAGEFDSTSFVDYSSERVDSRGPAAEFRARYRPIGPTFHARAGTLDHFLTARFCLYATDARSRLFRCEIDHAPWPLQRAEATIERNTMLAAHGLPTPTSLPILHFARQLDVAAWMLAPIGFVESKTSVCSTTADV